MNKKGLTLIELIVSLALLSVILIFMVNMYAGVRNIYNNGENSKKLELAKSQLSTSIVSDANTYRLQNITKSGAVLTFSYGGNEKVPAFNKTLKYSLNVINYECASNCNSELKITNVSKTLPSIYTFKNVQVNTLSEAFKVNFTIHDSVKNKDIPFIMYFNKFVGSTAGSVNSSHADFAKQNLATYISNFASGKSKTSTNVITAEELGDSCTNTLAYDGSSDKNLRYVGANPCNFVKFNNETWRIIGVMNNIDKGNGTKETRVKIIRDESIGSWAIDYKKHRTSGSTVYNSYESGGTNDWTKSDLMEQLNGDYLDYNLSADTIWEQNENLAGGRTYNHRLSINRESNNLIGDAVWNLGGVPLNHCSQFDFDCYGSDSRRFDNLKSKDAYDKERGTEVWNGGSKTDYRGTTTNGTCSDDSCPRATSWKGKVGLMYLSDYGLSVGGSVRNTCLDANLYDFHYKKSKCFYNTYIIDYRNTSTWTMTPISNSASLNATVSFEGNGSSAYVSSNSIPQVHPVVYLKSNVTYEKGLGTEENPIILGLG